MNHPPNGLGSVPLGRRRSAALFSPRLYLCRSRSGRRRLLVDQGHHFGCVPLSDDRHLLATFVDFPAIVFAELNVSCTHVVLKVFHSLSTRNRYDVFALSEEPSEGELGGGTTFPRSDFLNGLSKL